MTLADSNTDESLVGLILSGQKEMFSHLVKRYEAKLRRYVMSITNRRNDVDDVLQNVFLKAFVNLPAFDRKLRFSSWIYRIAHNESVNLIGSSLIQKFISLPEWFDRGRDEDLGERMDDQQIKLKLRKCVDQLDVKYREPLILFHYEEKSYEEISDIMRIPIRNVGVLIYRGRLQVKKICHEKNNI